MGLGAEKKEKTRKKKKNIDSNKEYLILQCLHA